jgi:hypothetical protein
MGDSSQLEGYVMTFDNGKVNIFVLPKLALLSMASTASPSLSWFASPYYADKITLNFPHI